jgi:hypothetical protein
MKGVPSSAGSASRRENLFRAGGGTRIHRVFRGGFRHWRSDRMLRSQGKGFYRPSGAGFHGETEPSAHALGYHLSALRAWGHGLGRPKAAKAYRDWPRFFPVSFRDRSRSRRVERGFAGRAHRPPGACRSGSFVGWEQCPFATFCDFCGHSLGIEAEGSHAKARRREEGRGRGGCRSAKTSLVNETGRISKRWKQGDFGSATTDTLAASRLCGLSVSWPGAMERRSRPGVRGGRGSVAPPGAGCA